MISLRGVGPEVDGILRFHPQQIAPFHGPVIGKFIAGQELIDQRIPFGWSGILDEFPGFRRSWEPTNHIEKRPPDEDRVGTGARRFDVQLLQASKDQVVNRAELDRERSTLVGLLGRRSRQSLCRHAQQDQADDEG